MHRDLNTQRLGPRALDARYYNTRFSLGRERLHDRDLQLDPERSLLGADGGAHRP